MEFLVKVSRMLETGRWLPINIYEAGNSVIVEAVGYLPYDKLQFINSTVEKLGGRMVSDLFMREKWEIPKPKEV